MKRADYDMPFLLRYENVAWYEDGAVRILDRRIYPIETKYVVCRTYAEVAAAIADMVTQSGGPYMAAAMGMALAAHEAGSLSGDGLLEYMRNAAYTLSHARPTTASKMERITGGALKLVERHAKEGLQAKELVETLRDYAISYIDDKYIRYGKTAEYLADLIPRGGTVMTQCFAETIVGTLIRECHRRGNDIRMICPETRPYFQGSRLTASVARDMGAEVHVITDNMPAFIMKQKKVDIFTSAADVITMGGYVINKVGTFQIALSAAYYGIPYYVTGTPDPGHETVGTVKLEYRDPGPVTEVFGTRLTKEGVKAYYPAFDVTPPKLITGVVTDSGVFSPYKLKSTTALQKYGNM